MCFPAVMMSHPWPSAAPHWVTWIGVKLARKSPESLSTERHLPSEVCQSSVSWVMKQDQKAGRTLMLILDEALVALSSRWWASAKANWSRELTALACMSGFAEASAAEARRETSFGCMAKGYGFLTMNILCARNVLVLRYWETESVLLCWVIWTKMKRTDWQNRIEGTREEEKEVDQNRKEVVTCQPQVHVWKVRPWDLYRREVQQLCGDYSQSKMVQSGAAATLLDFGVNVSSGFRSMANSETLQRMSFAPWLRTLPASNTGPRGNGCTLIASAFGAWVWEVAAAA